MRFSLFHFVFLCFLAGNLNAAVINTIEELDAAALFSFSIMSDGQGSSTLDYQAGNTDNKSTRAHRGDTWIKDHAAFVLGVGDHFLHGRGRKDELWSGDPWWHTSMYPIVADHDNDMAINGVNGKQHEWGRGAHLFTFLDIYTRPHVEFREPDMSSQIYSNEGDHAVAGWFDDQKVDYYARLDITVHPKMAPGYTVHVLGLHWGDSSTFAQRSKNFMVSKMQELAATKTDYDIIIVLIHQPYPWDYAISRGHMNWNEVNLMMNNADLTCYASTHKFGRDKRYDGSYDGNESFYMNTGCVIGDGTANYVDLHVFDNPPRMTIQCIDLHQSTRKLHVGTINSDPTHDYPGDQGKPWMKEINGPMSLINWNNFDVVPPPNKSVFVSQNIPTAMDKGQVYSVSVTMRNTGVDTWTTANGHALSSQNPADNTTWGLNRVPLPHDVAPNTDVTFSFNVTAPSTDEFYNMQWQMVDEAGDHMGNFGDLSTNERIAVGIPPALVTLYGNTGYSGFEASFGIGHFTAVDLVAAGGVNNDADSVKVTPGYQVEMFDNADFTGDSLIRTADDDNISEDGWHNKVSSLIVSAVGGPPQTIPLVSFADPAGDITIFSGSDLNITVQATDPEGIDRVRLYSNGVELARSEGNAPYTWGPGQADAELTNLQSGTYLLTARATDNAGDVGEASITVTVENEFNQPPVINTVPLTSAAVDVVYHYSMNATDSDGDLVIYSAVNIPSWTTFFSASGVLYGIPTSAHGGSWPVTLRVTAGSHTVDQNFTIVVPGGGGGSSDPGSDDDNDGIPYLVEIALGSDPNDSGSVALPEVGKNESNYDFTFRRAQSSISYTIEKSTDLINWSDYMPVTDSHGLVGTDATVSVPDTEMASGKLFLRLKVED